jgi:D-psicose/D-tagatose/L-ribulose 3-epimerase
VRVCMHTWMRPEPLATTIERLARCGYDGIEITSEPGAIDVGETRALLERHGIVCSGMLAFLAGARDLFGEDPYVRGAAVAYLRDTISLTAELGGTYVSVPPTVGKVVPLAAPAEEWGWYVEGLQACLDHATEHGVRLALEPLNRFESYLINRADQAYALAEAAGEACGVCLDIFHMNIEEADPLGAIRASADRLWHFHVADNNRLAPGDGSIDWGALLGTLADVGYDDWIAVEFMPAVDRTPVSERADIEDPDAGELSAAMVQWLRDHGSGILPEALYEEWVRRSVETLRAHMPAPG